MRQRPSNPVTVAVVLNLVAPYRAALFDRLAAEWDLHVVWTGWEDNRPTWPREYPGAPWTLKKAWGWVVSRRDRREGGVYHQEYLHIPPGVFGALRAIRPDVIISWEMGFRTLFALLFGYLSKTPVWVCWESPDHLAQNVGILRRWIRKRILNNAFGWISFSVASSRYLSRLGVPDEKVIQIQNTVDDRSFRMVAARRATSEGKTTRDEKAAVVLYVGQLVVRKGVDRLIQAVARAQERGLACRLVVAGEGPQRIALEQGAESSGTAVEFLGPVSDEALLGEYEAASVLVLPSSEEVWGLVVNEGLLSGVPVAASHAVGAAVELLPEEARFDPESPEDLDRVLDLALRGQLPQLDSSAVLSLDEVARRIVDGVGAGLGRATRSGRDLGRDLDRDLGRESGRESGRDLDRDSR